MLALLLLQLLPLPLILWLALWPLRAPAARAIQVAATAAALAATTLGAIWAAWWLPWLYLLLFAAALALAARRPSGRSRRAGWAAAALLGAFGAWSLLLAGQALAGRSPPAGPAVDLAFPLRGGDFLVANGGSSGLVNPHRRTLAPRTARQRAFHGQSHGLDIIAFGPWGLSARGLQPADPRHYAIYGATIHAPCAGTVVQAGDGVPDNRVPSMNSDAMVGNHVLLRCGAADVLLAHMIPGSVAVRAGERVPEGQLLGRVGNSGNSNAPHLHIHAQRPGTAEAPFSGEPLPIRFGGRYLVRGDRI